VPESAQRDKNPNLNLMSRTSSVGVHTEFRLDVLTSSNRLLFTGDTGKGLADNGELII
jgi:hypothetical protein